MIYKEHASAQLLFNLFHDLSTLSSFFLAATESRGSASGKGVTQATLADETKVAS